MHCLLKFSYANVTFATNLALTPYSTEEPCCNRTSPQIAHQDWTKQWKELAGHAKLQHNNYMPVANT